jgi:hypothetical protein
MSLAVGDHLIHCTIWMMDQMVQNGVSDLFFLLLQLTIFAKTDEPGPHYEKLAFEWESGPGRVCCVVSDCREVLPQQQGEPRWRV